MGKLKTSDIRNICLVGHGDSGKTSLVETMLFKAGVTSRIGRVEDGTTVCDHEPEEKEKKISLSSAGTHFPWKGKFFNVMDTPGYPDFVGEAIPALHAVETALLCINASSGIMVNTRKMWKHVVENKLATIMVVTKVDNENLDINKIIESIQETFGDICIPWNLPMGTGKALKSVVHVRSENIPKELSSGWCDKLMERIIESDDALLEKYLEGQEISQQEFGKGLTQSLVKRKLVPIFFVSSITDVGVSELMDFIAEYAPSPENGVDRVGVTAGGKEVVVKATAGGPFIAQVFKSIIDPFVGKLNYFRVFSGEIATDSLFYNLRTGNSAKIGQVMKVQGKELKPVEVIVAGDIGACSKVEEMLISDTIASEKESVRMPAIRFPEPMVSVAVEPKSRGDEQRLSLTLQKMMDQDSTFKVKRDRETGELVITGMSNLHLDVMLARMKRRFDVEVTTRLPKISYRETISTKADGHHRHKKQTGGRGQYGEVYIRIEPLPPGEGFQFIDEIVGGAIPNQYIPAVEKGIRETMAKGVIAGYPVVDVRVTLYDGTFHSVDSSEASFKIAASKAFQDAVQKAKPTLLEPIANIEVTIPAKFMGDITGDLNSRRGRIMGMDTIGNLQVIKAQVPIAEMQTYSSQLRSITAGEGSYTMEFSHYEPVPTRIAEVIIEKAKREKEKEKEE